MAKLAIRGGRPVRTKPFPSWPQGGMEERDWIEKVLKGHRWFAGLQGADPESLGTRFGDSFARLHGAQYGLPVSNGSVAIEIALRALGVRPGDEVLVPAYTFISTATSALMVGAIPVFCDIDPQTYCLDARHAAELISPHTRAIIPVHLGGHMADMRAINTLADAHGISVVEDSAQAIDAALEGKKAGTWGALATFSFQANKTITSGEGGLVMTSDEDLANKVIALRAFGRVRQAGVNRSSALPCLHLSSNYRLSEFQSAVLLGQLERFPEQDARRQANAEYLTRKLEQARGIEHVRLGAPSLKHGYYYYLLRYEREAFDNHDPERISGALQSEGIPFYPGDKKPLYRHPIFQPENLKNSVCSEVFERYMEVMARSKHECPATENACGNTLLLRHQTLLGEPQDMDDIIEALMKVRDNSHELQ